MLDFHKVKFKSAASVNLQIWNDADPNFFHENLYLQTSTNKNFLKKWPTDWDRCLPALPFV